jgi:hypothetical protein
MNTSKKASEIIPGDKIYTTEKQNIPSVVTASYSLGTNWALEVEGLNQILQVNPDDAVRIFPYK